MKYLRKTFIIILILLMILPSCVSRDSGGEVTEDTTAWLNMNLSYPSPTSLEDGGGRRARVIILIGQSNATGCSLNSYLEKNVPAEDFARYSAGYTISLEPEGDPDWGHYDSLSELALGRKFGELIVGAYAAE